MPSINEKELKSIIKASGTGAFLLWGDEDYLIKIYAGRLVDISVDETFRDFNLRVFEGDDISLEEVYESVISVPVMAEKKCVLVKDLATEKFTAKDCEAVETILRDNPEDNTLIFSYYASSPSGKNFKQIVKSFEKYGYSVEFPRMDRAGLAAVLENGARKRGKAFAPSAAKYMVDCVGDDLNLLGTELEKVCAYTDGELITAADVDEVCTKNLETKVFKMTGELVSGHFDAAFHMLSALLEQREEPTMIAGALISQYTDMYRSKALREAGLPSGDLEKYYASYKGKTFKIDKAAKAASSLTMRQMRYCIDVLAKADRDLKFTSSGAKDILEKTLVLLARSDKA